MKILKKKVKPEHPVREKPEISAENFIFLAAFLGFFAVFMSQMGVMNALNTMMNTAYSLLIDTVLYLTAICVLMGAVSALFSEFGVVSLANRLLNPLMVPLYNLPGAASLGVVTTFLSDNPAILSLAEDHYFKSLFKRYQFPALTNLGTSFGMGLIVCTYMLSLSISSGESYAVAVLVAGLNEPHLFVPGQYLDLRLVPLRQVDGGGRIAGDVPLVDRKRKGLVQKQIEIHNRFWRKALCLGFVIVELLQQPGRDVPELQAAQTGL